MAIQRFSRLTDQKSSFSSMLGRFGIVTVMNAKIYRIADVKDHDAWEGMTAPEIKASLEQDAEPICELKTLKIANVTEDGPSKSVTGGQFNNTLIKFGKTATIEIQDALGNAEALEALCGGLVEYNADPMTVPTANDLESKRIALHFTQDFSGPVAIVGDSFFIDYLTGEQVPVTLLFYNVSPDSLFNLTQDAEGDASVFDMNGTLNTQWIMVGDADGYVPGSGEENGRSVAVFYSIIAQNDATTDNKVANPYTITFEANKVSFNAGNSGCTAKFDGATAADNSVTLSTTDDVVLVDIYNSSKQLIESKIYRYQAE